MTLKTRLRLTILLPLLAVAVGYSLFNLTTTAGVLFDEASRHAMLLASQAQTLLIQRVEEYKRSPEMPADPAGIEAVWTAMASQDEALARLLEQTMASTRTAVEIDVRGRHGTVLSSSNPGNIGRAGRAATPMEEWLKLGRIEQIVRVYTHDEDFETIIPLGIAGQAEPVFLVRVLVSSILLRNTLLPEVNQLAFVLALSLLASLGIAILTADVAFLPIRRLSEAIDKVSRGETLAAPEKRESQEVQAVESKLTMLGQQVRGARENLKQLLERLEDAVLLFDEAERLVNAGRALDKFMPAGRWELTGGHVSELFPAGTPAGDLVQGAMALRQALDNVETVLAGRRVQVSLEVLEGRGFLVTLRDQEAQQSISRQLDVSQRLSALNRITGGVAHEIKNPLNSIGLHLEILNERIGRDDEVAAEEIRILRDETKRLDRVVKTFLNFTKPVELKLVEVDLAEIAQSLVQFLLPEAQAKNVELKWDSALERAPFQGDADLLKQALLNLMRNGMDAMPGGGQLRVGLTEQNGEWVLEIADGGVGIPEESRAKIFQLYFTTKPQGSGIGLAVTYRVVQLHNGSIHFDSTVGEGTTFSLRLPKREKDQQA